MAVIALRVQQRVSVGPCIVGIARNGAPMLLRSLLATIHAACLYVHRAPAPLALIIKPFRTPHRLASRWDGRLITCSSWDGRS